MTESDKKRFSVLMYWLAGRMAAPGGKPKEINPPLLSDYFDVLKDIRIERLEWGAKHIFATERWFPMPVELRQAAMLAPSSVLPKLENDHVQIPEFTEQRCLDARQQLQNLIDGLADHVTA